MDSLPWWVSVFGIVGPAVTIAGSAVAYVIKIYQDASVRRRKEFLEMMEFLDSDGPIAKKMTAIYLLGRFPEHKEFIIRFCNAQRSNIRGPLAGILGAEIERTEATMKALPHS